MAEKDKPEVHLEVCSGFFRIPTETVNYNITVLGSGESSATKVVKQIVEVEKKESKGLEASEAQSTEVFPSPSVENLPVTSDEYYKEVALCFSGEFYRLTESIKEDSVGTSEDAATGEGSDSLKKIEKTADEITGSLNKLKDQPELQSTGDVGAADQGEGNSAIIEELKNLSVNVVKAKEIVAEIISSVPEASSKAAEPAPPVEAVKKTRYLFDLDTVFQTMYELCTNETVKDHSQEARAKASEIFETNGFLDYISPKVESYDEDDGFLSVPITDVLQGLSSVCSDKKVINLFKNMIKQQAEIFLDKLLPLEVPPSEEVEVAGESGKQAEEAEVKAEEPAANESEDFVPRMEEVKELLDGIEKGVEKAAAQGVELTKKEDAGTDASNFDAVIAIIDTILTKVSSISSDVNSVSEEFAGIKSSTSSSQGISSEWQADFTKAALAMADCMSQKEQNPNLVFDGMPDLDGNEGAPAVEPLPEVATEPEEVAEEAEPVVEAAKEDEVVEPPPEEETESEDVAEEAEPVVEAAKEVEADEPPPEEETESEEVAEETEPVVEAAKEDEVDEPPLEEESESEDVAEETEPVAEAAKEDESEDAVDEEKKEEVEEDAVEEKKADKDASDSSEEDSNDDDDDDDDDDFGEASQDDIDKLLAELGG